MKKGLIEIDLSNLPQDKKQNILWNQCIGELVPFIYNNEVDYLKIVGYCKQQVTLELDGRVRRFHVRDVYYGHIEPLLGVYTQKFIYDPGTILGDYKIIEQIFIAQSTGNTDNNQLRGKQERKYRGYRIECLICGQKYEVKQKNIINDTINIKCDCKKRKGAAEPHI